MSSGRSKVSSSYNIDAATALKQKTPNARNISRRGFVARAAATAGLAGLLETGRQVRRAAPVWPRESIKITGLETSILENSWVFVKISNNAGIIGWGEMLKDKSKTCAAGAKPVEPYLLGKAILSDFIRIRERYG